MKDATSNAGKLIQPLLKLLSEDGSKALWVEAVIYSKIMLVKCTPSISKKFADCLALLPKKEEDEGNRSLMVTVPIQTLLEIVSRVLLVNGSLSPNTIPFIAAMKQEFIYLDLSILNLHGLDLLIAAIKGIHGLLSLLSLQLWFSGSQLLPNAAGVVKLLKEYFKKCESLALRDGVLATIRSSIIYFPSYFHYKIIVYYVQIFMCLLHLKDELLGLAEEPGKDPIYKNQSLGMDVLYRVGETQQMITYLLFQVRINTYMLA
ncbi:hypothetical protein GIB67_007840 [Kingdonia uniflora]|uniref:Uncharacterized protein n=1 Tax=Kingdonia uniflora TaxID=39325 RepID=A0A7J7N1X6_9MAGN|nr:hypothetical protein GIB67_007840 [Kingdonia uniflora]